jgi:hypothetical protein
LVGGGRSPLKRQADQQRAVAAVLDHLQCPLSIVRKKAGLGEKFFRENM